MNGPTVSSLLQGFFTERLVRQLQASPQTISAYRDTIRLLLLYAARTTKKSPSHLEIDDLNAELSGITLLKGIEVDILEDGALDLPDSVLKKLDVVVAAVHSGLKLSRARQTARILAALDNPYVRILAHPTGRLIGEREPCDVDMLAVVRKARARGVALELNAHPDRLDLNEVHCRMAKDEGVLVALGSDAHGVDGFDVLRYGVGQARRGWLERKDVLNTRPLAELKRWLKAQALE